MKVFSKNTEKIRCVLLCVFYFLTSAACSLPKEGGKRESDRGRGSDAADDESPSGLYPLRLNASSGPEPGPGI